MNILQEKTFLAQATFGLCRWYSDEEISITKFKQVLWQVQKIIYEKYAIALSTKITLTTIVFLWQDEPSVHLEWIQYPKFPIGEDILKKTIIEFVENLMKELDQKRVVLIFQDKTIMFENDENIDPRIIL